MLLPKLYLHCLNVKSIPEYNLQSDMDLYFGKYAHVFLWESPLGNHRSLWKGACVGG